MQRCGQEKEEIIGSRSNFVNCISPKICSFSEPAFAGFDNSGFSLYNFVPLRKND